MDATIEMVNTKNTVRLLPCELSTDEMLKVGRRLAETGNRLTAEQAVQAQQAKEMKARTAAIEAERASLSSLLMSGTENRDVACTIYYDLARMMVEVQRDDTKAVVETRRMTDAEIREHQPKLPLGEPDKADGPGPVLAFDRATSGTSEAKSDEDLAEIEKALAAAEGEGMVAPGDVTDEQLDAVDAMHDAEEAEAADDEDEDDDTGEDSPVDDEEDDEDEDEDA